MKVEISAKGIEIEDQYGGYWSNKSKAEASWTIGGNLEIESSTKNTTVVELLLHRDKRNISFSPPPF